MKQKIEQRQIQKLILTQTLRQSIELLQYSQVQLEEKIEEEAKENPFLKLKKKEYIPFWDLETFVDHKASDRKQKALENVAAKTKTLYSQLMEQISYLNLTDKEQEAVHVLISSLDKNGFLTQDPETLLKPFGFSSEKILQLRKKIAGLDPPGCCAMDYIESMIFQLELKEKSFPEAKIGILLLTKFQKELEEKKFNEIIKKAHIQESELKRTLSLLRTLNPFPGKEYSYDETIYIEPDVYIFVEKKSDSDYEFQVVLNEKTIQNIEFNKDYIRQVQKEQKLTKKELKELKKKYYNAQFLIKALQQRNETLLRVTQVIVEFQREFLITGKNLKPLRLKDISQELGLHESTISRVTTNKYAYTRWGIYELKFFFRRGLKHLHGEKSFSIEEVKNLIQLIIQKEDKSIPLKDQEIAEILMKKGIKIARRTVAKYRKEMNIPSAFERLEKSSN